MTLRYPLYATEPKAAALLDVKPREFRKLVDEGHLPPPVCIGGELKRWDVRQLQEIISGSKARGEHFEW